MCEKDRISLRELPLLDDVELLMEYIPSTNEELKKLKKEIRQKAVNKVERSFVLNALMQNDWNVTRTAEKVGLQRTNFQSLMKKHSIIRPKNIKPIE